MPGHEGKAAAMRQGQAWGFVKATLVGGLIFLLPLGIFGYLIGKAVGLAVTAGEPAFRLLPHTAFWLTMVPLMAAFLLLLIALLAGLFARTLTGQRFLGWIEGSLFGGVPQYQFMKSMAEGVAKIESAPAWEPVLLPALSGWRIGFVVERVDEDWAVVFLPQSPSATVGDVVIAPAAQLRPLPQSMAYLTGILKRMGLGLQEVLAGIDLTPAPPPAPLEISVPAASGTEQTGRV